MSSYESDIFEPIYGAYNWAEFDGNQPLPDEYVPSYMRSSTADRRALPARDVLCRASEYVNNTTPPIPTAFGGNMLRRAAHLPAVTGGQVEANKESKKNKEEEARSNPPVPDPAGAVLPIFGDHLYEDAFPSVYTTAALLATTYQPPINPTGTDAAFRRLLALTWGGDSQTAASGRSLAQVGAGEFSYTYTPYRAGINLRALPAVSQDLPATDDRGQRMSLFRYELTKKVNDILNQYGLPQERYVEPCGRKRALHLTERPIPTILITMSLDDDSKIQELELALHSIVIMASECFLLRDICVEVIDPRLEHPAEHPDLEPTLYPRRPRSDRTGAMIAPPLELALILIECDWYRWDPETWDLNYVPESMRRPN